MAIPIYTKEDVILQVDNLSLSLNGNLILKDINFTIRDIIRPGMIQGQITSCIAKSGAGKSQFMKCVSGLYNPIDNAPDKNDYAVMTGSIKLGNPLVTTKLGNVGYLMQDYPLFEGRTVLSNLYRAAKCMNSKEKKEKGEYYLNEFSLWDKRDCYPIQLSGGQRQRVAIIQQLMCSKHLIIMDEPFSGLDSIAIDAVVKVLHKISCMDELNTIFIVTHDIATACAVSDDIILMGRDKDGNGNYIPGTSIKKEYNLIEEGIAWQEDVRDLPQFANAVREIRNEFSKW